MSCPVILVAFLILTSSLKVTGPLNCERTVLEFPPSTTSLSLIVTSSNTTLKRFGSSPVIVGFGISYDIISPLAAEVLVFPLNTSPLLFIPL